MIYMDGTTRAVLGLLCFLMIAFVNGLSTSPLVHFIEDEYPGTVLMAFTHGSRPVCRVTCGAICSWFLSGANCSWFLSGANCSWFLSGAFAAQNIREKTFTVSDE